MAVKYYTFKKKALAAAKPGQRVKFTKGKGWYITGKATAPKPKPKPAVNHAAERRAKVVSYARTLVGIRELPIGSHSNDGPAVHLIQSSTGAYRAPWCVSTVQRIWQVVLGSTWADRTANAYYLARYAQNHGHAIPHPIPGCAVVYYIGAGHAGTVVNVHPDGTFDAVEGNEGDAVRLVPRDPRRIHCTFILRPELKG